MFVVKLTKTNAKAVGHKGKSTTSSHIQFEKAPTWPSPSLRIASPKQAPPVEKSSKKVQLSAEMVSNKTNNQKATVAVDDGVYEDEISP